MAFHTGSESTTLVVVPVSSTRELYPGTTIGIPTLCNETSHWQAHVTVTLTQRQGAGPGAGRAKLRVWDESPPGRNKPGATFPEK